MGYVGIEQYEGMIGNERYYFHGMLGIEIGFGTFLVFRGHYKG